MFAAALTLAQNRKRPACPPPGRVTLTVGYNPRLEEQAGTGMVQKATRSIHRKFLKNYNNREQMGGAGVGAGPRGSLGRRGAVPILVVLLVKTHRTVHPKRSVPQY